MPVIKGTKTETQNISGTGKTWTVAVNAKISGEEMAIFEDGASSDNTLKILGSVKGVTTEEHPAATAVFTFGARTEIEIAKSAKLSGFNGAIAYGDDAVINNAGKITAIGGLGIEISNFGGAGTVINSGKVVGETGVYVYGAGIAITNAKTGSIIGQENGVEMVDTAAGHKLTNLGKITGVADDGFAVLGSDENDKVINRGTIKGAIDLGDGADRFEFRGGKLNHAVAGGEGDDLLITKKASVKLLEQDGDGWDTVRSSVSYVLGDFVDQLMLTGRKAINGTGSEETSWLYGNAGKNTLRGMGGEDLLNGGKGADILIGGDDADTFELAKGGGKDTVKDFVDGTDYLRVIGFAGVDDPGDIDGHIIDKGNDVWIKMNNKDILILKNVDASLIDGDDFSFVM